MADESVNLGEGNLYLFLNRTRIRSNQSNGNVLITYTHTEGPCRREDIPISVPTGSYYYELTDVRNGMKSHYNPVYHEKYKGGYQTNFTFSAAPGGPGSGLVTTVKTNGQSISVLSGIRAHLPVPSDLLIDDLSAMAEDHFTQLIGDKDNLLEFLSELIQACSGCIGKAQKLLKRLEGIQRSYTAAFNRFIKQGHSHASAGWLAWSFAVKPNIRSIMSWQGQLISAVKRLAWLQKNNHKPTKVSYRVKSCFPVSPGSVTFEPSVGLPSTYLWQDPYPHPAGADPDDCAWSTGNHNERLQVRLVEYQCTFTATAWILFDVADWLLEPIPGVISIHAAGQGLFRPVRTLWDLVPYSWLIDWFVSYRTRLQERSLEIPVFPKAQILSAGHSWKVRTVWSCGLTAAGVYTPTGSLATYSIYTRQEGLPKVSVSPFRLPYSGFQLSIGASLLTQRIRRR